MRHALEDLRVVTPKLVSSRPEFRAIRQSLQPAAQRVVPTTSERILIFSETGGWVFQQAWFGLIAKGLEVRGAHCEMLLCGGKIPTCHVMSGSDGVGHSPEDMCRACTTLGLWHHEAMDLKTTLVTKYFEPAVTRELETALKALPDEQLLAFEWRGYPLGKNCLVSAACQARTDATVRSPDFWDFLRRSMQAAGQLLVAFETALKQLKPTRILLWNGLMFSQEPLIWLARREEIPYVSVEGGWDPDTITLSHNDSTGQNCNREWAFFRHRPLEPQEAQEVESILSQRRAGQSIVSHYWQDMVSDAETVKSELKLDPNKPIALLCSNITWDSAVVGKEVAFPSLLDWVFATIEWFAEHPDQQLVIRAHPAEISIVGQRESKIKVVPEIERRYPQLPPNVRVIPSSSKLSTYLLMDMASIGLVLSSTAGLEMVTTGKPVIVVGRAHYHNKGFSLDPYSPEEYREMLNLWQRGELKVPGDSINESKRYIHLYMRKMMIPFPLVKMNAEGTRYDVQFQSLADLEPGKDQYLDLICDGILKGKPFCLNFDEAAEALLGANQ